MPPTTVAPDEGSGFVAAEEYFSNVRPKQDPATEPKPAQSAAQDKPAPSPAVSAPAADAQPLWTPQVETPPVTEEEDDDDLENAVEEGEVDPTAPSPASFEVYNEDDFDEGDELAAKRPLFGKGKRLKRQKEDASKEEQRKADLFKSKVNQDGYYDTRKPIDDELTPEELRKGQWFRMVIAAAGIFLFAWVLIQLQSLL